MPMSAWNTTSLPDSDTTVILRLDDEADSIATGFHDGEDWRFADAGLVEVRVIGWMDLHAAARKLDQ